MACIFSDLSRFILFKDISIRLTTALDLDIWSNTWCDSSVFSFQAEYFASHSKEPSISKVS